MNFERFKRVLEKRMAKAVSAIRSLSTLSDDRWYSYSPEQIKEIESILETEIKQLIVGFNKQQ